MVIKYAYLIEDTVTCFTSLLFSDVEFHLTFCLIQYFTQIYCYSFWWECSHLCHSWHMDYWSFESFNVQYVDIKPQVVPQPLKVY